VIRDRVRTGCEAPDVSARMAPFTRNSTVTTCFACCCTRLTADRTSSLATSSYRPGRSLAQARVSQARLLGGSRSKTPFNPDNRAVRHRTEQRFGASLPLAARFDLPPSFMYSTHARIVGDLETRPGAPQQISVSPLANVAARDEVEVYFPALIRPSGLRGSEAASFARRETVRASKGSTSSRTTIFSAGRSAVAHTDRAARRTLAPQPARTC